MKKGIICMLLLGILISCDTNDGQDFENQSNKVILLKIDYLTSVFEGGKELEFSESSNFTISSTYRSPGDFGDIQLFYEELNEKIFDGTIIWMGKGEVSYPSSIDIPNSFATNRQNIPMPDVSMFENIMYSQFAIYPDTMDYSNIWNAIDNLKIVSKYLNSNPNGKIHLFLYTPSVGVGNPADWDWYIFMKN